MKTRGERKGRLSRSEKVLVIVAAAGGFVVIVFSVVMIWLISLI
jgi:hypothetical protein